MQWQPIETAPKPHVKILLRYSEEEVCVGYWEPFETEGEYGVGDRAWCGPGVGILIQFHKNSPTHWMPIPQLLS